MTGLDPFMERSRIAYISMEIAIKPEIHTYSGGLGILAGDVARSCADLELPVVLVTLVSREGYLRQEIATDGRQVDHPDPWLPVDWAAPLDAMIAVEIEGRSVWTRAWLHVVESPLGGDIPVILLDTDVDQNNADDRRITDRLYGGDAVHRLKQEAVLGVGAARMLRALGFEIEFYHLNEGHAALLAVELLRKTPNPIANERPDDCPSDAPSDEDLCAQCLFDVAHVRARCAFTTHTPVEAGHDRFDYEDVKRVLGDFIYIDQLRLLGGPDHLNMTRLALNLSGYVNGVARRHAETTRHLFPGYRISAVTNGVHPATWVHPGLARLLDGTVPGWGLEPELLVRADQLPNTEVWAAHQEAKHALLDEIQRRTGFAMAAERPLIGFARRMTAYKRPDLLFADLERLRSISRLFPFQLVMAGKAHPRDEPGKQLIQEIHGHIRDLAGDIPITFVPDYDMEFARALVSGSDIWLNTPLPPLEASGTSGMKAALNGVLCLSTLDGWWLEACIEGVTGWAIGDTALGTAGDDAEELYLKLERTVLPLYYGDRDRWVWMMTQSLSKIGSYFNSHRMMKSYAVQAYFGRP